MTQLGEEIHVSAQREERQCEHVQQHGRRGRRRQEQGARSRDDEQEQHVAPPPSNIGARRGANCGRVRSLHVCLAMSGFTAAVRAERRLAGTLRLARTAGTGTGSSRAVQCRLTMVRMSRPAGSRRTLERRRCQWTADRAHARRRGALQGAQLATEVGDRRVGSVVDTRSQHRRDEHGRPGGGDDEENELGH